MNFIQFNEFYGIGTEPVIINLDLVTSIRSNAANRTMLSFSNDKYVI